MKKLARLSLAVGCLTLSACSLEIVNVHPARIESARKANQPLQRGPGAPGAFKRVWNFGGKESFRYDPALVELSDGVAKLKKGSGTEGHPFARESTVVETGAGMQFVALDSFTETLGPGNQGQVRYQLSNDGARWFYFDGKTWAPAGPNPELANPAAEVNSKISDFHTTAGDGSIHVRAFLVSKTGDEQVELKAVQVEGVAPLN